MKLLQLMIEKESHLAEGVMDLSVGGSDSASDLAHDTYLAAVKVLRKGLTHKGNEWNTDGYINVALILTELFKGVHNEAVVKLAKDVKANLEKRDNKKPFGGDLNKLIKELGKFKEI